MSVPFTTLPSHASFLRAVHVALSLLLESAAAPKLAYDSVMPVMMDARDERTEGFAARRDAEQPSRDQEMRGRVVGKGSGRRCVR